MQNIVGQYCPALTPHAWLAKDMETCSNVETLDNLPPDGQDASNLPGKFCTSLSGGVVGNNLDTAGVKKTRVFHGDKCETV